MKKILVFLLFIMTISCQKESIIPMEEPSQNYRVSSPIYSHIFVLWMENKTYTSIVGSSSAPYMNLLMSQGTLFTRFNAIDYDSQPNYIGGFAGSRCGVSNNTCLSGRLLTQKNLYTQLSLVGKGFETYCEGLPSVGSTTCSSGRYRRRHNAPINFSNVPSSVIKPLTMLPTNLNTCGTVVWIVPNNDHNMHDQSISYGDNWIKNNLQVQSIINYCKNPANNSLFVLYFDEGTSSSNKIAVTFVGNRVKVNYKNGITYNHYSFNKTVLKMHGTAVVNSATSSAYAYMTDYYN